MCTVSYDYDDTLSTECNDIDNTIVDTDNGNNDEALTINLDDNGDTFDDCIAFESVSVSSYLHLESATYVCPVSNAP